MASASIDNREYYPGQNFSISQLLYATEKKLQGATFGGRYVLAVLWRSTIITQKRTLQDRDDPEPG